MKPDIGNGKQMADILYLTTIKFDFGVVSTLAGEASALGISRPLLVSDRRLAERWPVAGPLLAVCRCSSAG